MKRSNLLLVVLSVIFISGIYVTDTILAKQYLKINLNDPYKNYQYKSVQPFKAVRIMGGNSYAIRIQQGKEYSIQLLNSRKSFFTMKIVNDTLSIGFTVSNSPNPNPGNAPVGLIITVPKISCIQSSGTNNEIGPFLQDSLTILQDKNTTTRLKDLHLDYLNLKASGMSYYDFLHKNSAEHLMVTLQNTAVINFNQVSFLQFRQVLKDSASVIFYKEAMDMLMLPDSTSDSGNR